MSDAIRKEVMLMKMLKHPNVVSLKEVLSSRSKLFLVLELVDGGDLFDLLDRSDYVQEDLCRSIFQQLICGVEFCHIRGILHRDLKPENILIGSLDN